jgi:D-beta-D-heptose 7-phosphate kinase/D-beta-D-heptose 1-phosphate adenosyltransferase
MKIGFCNGCFDVFHAGHRYFLEKAREHCDYLIVAINSDESVTRLKGDGRPKWVWERRSDEVMETGLVDAVIPFEGLEHWLIGQINPDVVIRGAEYRDADVAHDRSLPGRPPYERVYIDRIPGFSTTEEIARCQD